MPYAAQQPQQPQQRTGQFLSPTTVPTANVPQTSSYYVYSNPYWEEIGKRDIYGNIVPSYGPINPNEGWEFTDIPIGGYGYGGGGWGGYGGGGWEYDQEASAPFYRGNYTQSKSRWNETLLTWGLRQE